MRTRLFGTGYTHRPLEGLLRYLVINHNLEDFDLDNRFHSALSEASVKFSYTFRF